jgi:hypothetical protein
MALQEHIHVISAGEGIYEAYARTVRDHPDITHLFVFADTELYTNNARDGDATRVAKETAREAVSGTKALAASLKIPALLVYISLPADASARDAILKIRKEHPGARFSFDLSAGSKDTCMALFTLSLWVQGDTCYSFAGRKGEAVQKKLPVPKTTVESVAANPNYVKILQTLYRPEGEGEPVTRLVPRSYLFLQLGGFYVPMRKKGVKIAPNTTGKTDLYTGKRAVLHELSQGTFSNILATMTTLDLIEEMPGPGNNRKEKTYRITPSGELVLQFALLRPRKP